MISRETRIMIRHQVNQGESKAIVARRLGVSRQTVYNPSGKKRTAHWRAINAGFKARSV